MSTEEASVAAVVPPVFVAGPADLPAAPDLHAAPRFQLPKAPPLKNKVTFKAFAEYDIPSLIGHRNISCAERMRELDLFHFHAPTAEERAVVHLPSERLNLQSPKEVFYLCGGLVGVRFEGHELRHLTELTTELSRLWDQLAAVFTLFHLALKKFRIEAQPDPNCASTKSVMEFHDLGDRYLSRMRDLQDIVVKKQATIDRDAYYNHEITRGDPDSDGKAGHVYPVWFTVLRTKYETEVLDTAMHTHGLHRRPSLTLGKFAVYLGSHALDRGSWTDEEVLALEEVPPPVC